MPQFLAANHLPVITDFARCAIKDQLKLCKELIAMIILNVIVVDRLIHQIYLIIKGAFHIRKQQAVKLKLFHILVLKFAFP